jgi:hypothetical protein
MAVKINTPILALALERFNIKNVFATTYPSTPGPSTPPLNANHVKRFHVGCQPLKSGGKKALRVEKTSEKNPQPA